MRDMRRLLMIVTSMAVLGMGSVVPAEAQPASSPTDAVTGGTVTIVVGHDPVRSNLTWTTTISGQIAAGGRVYSGSASGTNPEGYSVLPNMSLAGTSATGSISASCVGDWQGAVVPGPGSGEAPAGL